MNIIRVFHLKIFSFLEVKITIYLNRRVFVMPTSPFSRDLYQRSNTNTLRLVPISDKWPQVSVLAQTGFLHNIFQKKFCILQ